MNQASVTELAQSLVHRPVVKNLQHGFADDASYASILTKTEGAQNIERLYQLFAMVEPFTPEVTNVEYDDQALTASISFSSPIVLPLGILKNRLAIPTKTLLHFKHAGENNKLVIDKQVDLAPFGLDAKLVSLPVLGNAYKNFLLPALSFFILQIAILVIALRAGANLREEKDLKYNNEIAKTVDIATPYINQARTTASPYIEAAQEKAQQAQATATQTVEYAQKRAQETYTIAQERAQPYIDNVQPLIKTATVHAQHAQEIALDALSRVPVVNEVLAKQGFAATNGKSAKSTNGTNGSSENEPATQNK